MKRYFSPKDKPTAKDKPREKGQQPSKLPDRDLDKVSGGANKPPPPPSGDGKG